MNARTHRLAGVATTYQPTTVRWLLALTACLSGMAATRAPGLGPGQVMSFNIKGKVQGVFFRKHTQAEAARLGLAGWCENTKQGTVRGEAHGDAAALDKFAHWLRHKGSPKSRIDSADFAAVSKDPASLQSPFAIVK